MSYRARGGECRHAPPGLHDVLPASASARLRLDRLAPPYTRVYGRFIVSRIFIRPLWTVFKNTDFNFLPENNFNYECVRQRYPTSRLAHVCQTDSRVGQFPSRTKFAADEFKTSCHVARAVPRSISMRPLADCSQVNSLAIRALAVGNPSPAVLIA